MTDALRQKIEDLAMQAEQQDDTPASIALLHVVMAESQLPKPIFQRWVNTQAMFLELVQSASRR